MIKERETKGTVVYSDLDGNLKTVYIPRTEFPGVIPDRIDLTIHVPAETTPRKSSRNG